MEHRGRPCHPTISRHEACIFIGQSTGLDHHMLRPERKAIHRDGLIERRSPWNGANKGIRPTEGIACASRAGLGFPARIGPPASASGARIAVRSWFGTATPSTPTNFSRKWCLTSGPIQPVDAQCGSTHIIRWVGNASSREHHESRCARRNCSNGFRWRPFRSTPQPC